MTELEQQLTLMPSVPCSPAINAFLYPYYPSTSTSAGSIR